MSNTKFTKGAWFVERYHTMLDVSVVGFGSICTVDTDYVMSECMIDPSPEQEANANLIAVAPDMYNAMYEFIGSACDDDIESAREIFIGILKKARGE